MRETHDRLTVHSIGTPKTAAIVIVELQTTGETIVDLKGQSVGS